MTTAPEAPRYDTIGRTYAEARRSDPRIAAQIRAAIGEVDSVLNVGAGTGNGILMDNSSQFQGGLFSAYAVRFANNARSDGPIVGKTMIFDNNVSNDQFDTITTVPVGMPGNPAVYAQPNRRSSTAAKSS